MKHISNYNKVKFSNTSNLTSSGGLFFQPKLSINQPNDVYDQEANAMADKVMQSRNQASNKNTFFKPTASMLQRKCAHCEEDKQLNRKEGSNDATVANASTENYINVSSG